MKPFLISNINSLLLKELSVNEKTMLQNIKNDYLTKSCTWAMINTLHSLRQKKILNCLLCSCGCRTLINLKLTGLGKIVASYINY